MALHDKHLWLINVMIVVLFPRVAFMAEPAMDDYVDPFDMFNFDPVNMRMKYNHPKQDQNTQEREELDIQIDMDADIKQEPEASSFCKTTDESCKKIRASHEEIKGVHEILTTLLRQYAMTLTQHMESKVSSNSAPTDLNLRVKVTYHSLSVLRRFGQGEHSNFHSLHEILSSLVQFAEHVKSESAMDKIYWLEDWIGLSWPMMLLLALLISSASVLIYIVSHLQWSKALFFRLILLTFLVSVVFNMLEMYQAKVADQEKLLRKRYEEHCPSEKDMSWSQWLEAQNPFSFTKDTCTEYMRAMRINPFFSASPIEAMALAVVKTFMTPMGHIGRGFRELLEGLLDGLPIQFQFFVLVMLFIVMVYIPTILLDYRFSFLYGLINIGPQNRQNNYIEPVQPDPVQHPVHQERMIDVGPERLPSPNEHHISYGVRKDDEISSNSKSLLAFDGRADRPEIASPFGHNFGNVEGARVDSVPLGPQIGFEPLQRKISVTEEKNSDFDKSDRANFTTETRDIPSCSDAYFAPSSKNVTGDYLAGGDNTLVTCRLRSTRNVEEETQFSLNQTVRFQDTGDRKSDKLCQKMAEVSLEPQEADTAPDPADNCTVNKIEIEGDSGKVVTDCVSKQMDKLKLNAEKEIDRSCVSDIAT